jgi:hypothetical protein
VGRGQPDADMLVSLCKLYGARISDFYEPEYSSVDTPLSSDEDILIGSYRMLNNTGKDIARDIVDTMVKSGKYS